MTSQRDGIGKILAPAKLIPAISLTMQADSDAAAASALAAATSKDNIDSVLVAIGLLPGFHNKIINGEFTINQRTGTRTPGVGVYGFDRWKGHADGLEQICEALEAGEYTLTWTGGGTGTFGGTTASSPFTATVTAGNRSVIVPDDATRVSLVLGDATTTDPFSSRHVEQELSLCKRYYQMFGAMGIGKAVSATSVEMVFSLCHMRAVPATSLVFSASNNLIAPGVANLTATAIVNSRMGPMGGNMKLTVGAGGMTVGTQIFTNTANYDSGFMAADAEL